MKNTLLSLIIITLFGIARISAQSNEDSTLVASTSDYLVIQPVPDRKVEFSVNDEGKAFPIFWGLDTAWPDENNIRRGVAFMGADRVDIVRASFQPTLPLINGDLQADQVSWLNRRLNLIDLVGPNAKVALNSDHPSVHEWYKGNAVNWALLMDVTTRRVQERGRTVVSIAPFNEPDYTAVGQGTVTDFYNIAGELRKNPRFDNIRISGGNTLNADEALPWYNQLKTRLDEGNTHQLAGSFDNYATFFQTVRANGHYATNDELHNVMEAMVGVQYGMQTGIWWGTAELARGEFVKASDGVRLGYAEHRPNWTAASVYRGLEGKVQGFVGSSERQAVTTTYRFVSKDRDVYYDGHGPQRDFTVVMPGGTGYQQGQTNAERVVNITWGDDIQPVINGRYILVNRNSSMVMEVAGGSTAAGANVRQGNNLGQTYQQFNVTPVDSRIGGDFSYFTITAVHSGKSFDIYNWSLSNGGNIVVWDDAKGGNQQWYLDYAEDGWFYIRSRHSAKCLEVANDSKIVNANIQQWEKDGGANQQWRFLPVGTTIDFTAPAALGDLVVQANELSVRLDWSNGTEGDLDGYTVFRSETAGGPFQTIARQVKTTAFVDNTVTMGKEYFYAVKAVDRSQNRSAYSNEVSATAIGGQGLVANYRFEGNAWDTSVNRFNSMPMGGVSYVVSRDSSKAVNLNGTNAYLQLPVSVANHEEITVATWVYLNGLSTFQRIFDFGNDKDEYMFLTPISNLAKTSLVVKYAGKEQRLSAPWLTTGKWWHLAVTMGASGARLYINGELADESTAIMVRPKDIMPTLNYIGWGPNTIRYLNGNVDDFRIYNYSLSATEIAQLASDVTNSVTNPDNTDALSLWPVPATDRLQLRWSDDNRVSTVAVYDINGRMVISKEVYRGNAELNVSSLPPGIYMLHLTTGSESVLKKRFIKQ